MSSRSKKACLLAIIDHLNSVSDKEEDAMIVAELRRRKPTNKMFVEREEEGAYNTLITRHLLDNGVKFREFCRFTPDQFSFLMSLVRGKLTSVPYGRVSKPISPEAKLALTLRFLATGESYHSLQFSHRISVAAISKIIPQVLKTLKAALLPLCLPPADHIDWKMKAEEFWKRWSFPNVIGAIDGKHVRIVGPANSGSLYFNYKNYFSIVLLAMVDANYKFLLVDIGSYGKEGDAGIFNKSEMGKLITNGSIFPPPRSLPNSDVVLPHVILGDEAFRLDEHVMKPYCKAQALEDANKRRFNSQLSKARRVSENAFGILCSVFRIFFTPINVKPETVDSIIIVSCCLHNFLRDEYIRENPIQLARETQMFDLPRENMVPLRRTGGYTKANGFLVRQEFTNYFNRSN